MFNLKKIIIMTILILLIFTFSAAAFKIKIMKEVEVSSPKITLGEIAEIKASNLSQVAVEKLINLSLKSSPNPGYQKRLSRALVDLTIQNLGYNKSQFQLEMPNTVIVSRKSAIIKEEEIAVLVEDYLKANLNFAAEKIVVESRGSFNELKIAAGDYDLIVAEDQNLSLPNTNLKLEVRQNGDLIRSFFYPVNIKLNLGVLTANKDLKSKSKLSKSDFKLTEKQISGDPEEIISDWSEVDFKNIELLHSLNKGEILKFNNLKEPYVVNWGQKLNLRVNLNNINISTFVEAKERGKIGEIITVENLSSGYQFQAEVVSSTEVQIK